MSNQEESLLLIEPQTELKFYGPFKYPVSSWIMLTNVTDKNVFFKLKTTAPKRYCVRPNSGFLTPKENLEVQISLQPFNFNPTEKNKHKFMVQSVMEPEGWNMNVDELWRVVDSEKIMNHKLKCVFEIPTINSDHEEEETNFEATLVDDKPKKAVENKSMALPASGKVDKAPLEVNKALIAHVKELQEANSKILHEKIALQEELIQLNQELGNIDAGRHSYLPPAASSLPLEGGVPLHFIAFFIVSVLLSFIFGKFVV